MDNRRLTKLALMGLLVSTTGVTTDASASENHSQGTLLAAGCASCKASRQVSMNDHSCRGSSPRQSNSGYYNPDQSNSNMNHGSSCAGKANGNMNHGGSCAGKSNGNVHNGNSNGGTSGCGGKGGCGGKSHINSESQQQASPSENGKVAYNYGNNPNSVYYVETSTTAPANAQQSHSNSYRTGGPSSSSSYNMNRGYNSTQDEYSAPQTQPAERSYTNANSSKRMDYNHVGGAETATTSKRLSEAELLGKLNNEGRKLYWSLDKQGRAKAIELASEDSYADKNEAVKEASKEAHQNSNSMMNHSSNSKY